MASEQLERREFYDTYEPAIVPKLMSRTYIDYPFLTELEDKDFDTESKTLINIKEYTDKAQFVLFIDQRPESQRYLKMWLKIAEEIKDEHCDMTFCNLKFEKRIAERFKVLSQKRLTPHPFHWAGYQKMPFALVYRDGWPQGFYNGGFYYQDLLSFCINQVPDFSLKLEKFQKVRPTEISSTRMKEMELMEDLERDRQLKLDSEKREKMKKMNTREQVIAHAVSFD